MITSTGDSVGHQGPINTYAQTINKNDFYLPSEIIPLVNHPLLPNQTLLKVLFGLSPKVDLLKITNSTLNYSACYLHVNFLIMKSLT